MRVLYVHECLGSFGGAEGYVLATARALRARGHEVGLAAQKRSGKGEEAWAEVFGSNVSFPKNAADWRALVDAFRPDAAYIHKWEDLEGLEWLLGTNLPLVRMVHDHDLYCLRSYKYNPITRRICTRPAGSYCVFPCLAPLKRDRSRASQFRWASFGRKLREIDLNRRFDRLIVASRYMEAELLRNRFDPLQIAVEPAVPPPGAAGSGRESSSFGDENLLLYVGQIVRGKGVDALLKSLAQVKGNFRAFIVGEGHHRAKCERLCARLRLEAKVQFLGFIPSSELESCYARASAVTVSSLWPEPFGMVGIEAMRHGLPLVGFDAGAVREWLRDGQNGFLVPWNDTGAYARAVDRLLADKSLARRLGENGRKLAELEYDFDRSIARLEALLARVAAEPRRRAA
ncbi:MAG: glycosyltransferase family 4 protein [Verrucomicrobiae bacterium]|nr:glycosyltransferase family 4 protein [Verrucomicrobiae bacterium]